MTTTIYGCVKCKPEELNPSGERLGDNHFGVRFDATSGHLVYLNGALIEDAYEVVTGPGGYALRINYPLDFHGCRKDYRDQSVVCYRDDDDGYTVEPVDASQPVSA